MQKYEVGDIVIDDGFNSINYSFINIITYRFINESRYTVKFLNNKNQKIVMGEVVAPRIIRKLSNQTPKYLYF